MRGLIAICIVVCGAFGCTDAQSPDCEDYSATWCQDGVETTVIREDCETMEIRVACLRGCDDEGTLCND